MASITVARFNTVLFDYDGTLMDTNALIFDSWRHTVKTLSGREITDEEIRTTLGEIITHSMRCLLPEADEQEAINAYREYQRDKYLNSIKLFGGAKETLIALREKGCKTGLLTSRLRPTTEKGLAHFGLANLFDAVLTASDTDKFKPDPAPVFQILEMLNSRPEEALLIGDTAHDIQAAKAAGVYAVLVNWSAALPKEKRTETPPPDQTINTFAELLPLTSNVFSTN